MAEQRLDGTNGDAFASIAALRAFGFEGFESIRALRSARLRSVPAAAGVYLLVRDSPALVTFHPRSPAGVLQGRDPTISANELRLAWVPGALVLYVGKAGGAGVETGLRRRLSVYLRHGAGHRAAHWGGRAIWQLSDSDELLVAWRADLDCEPRELERRLIERFVERHGVLPFANRAR